MSTRAALALSLAAVLLLTACSSAQKPASTAQPFDVSVLRNALDSASLDVSASDATAQAAYSATAQRQPLIAGGRLLDAYWFASAQDARSAAEAGASTGAGATSVEGTAAQAEGRPQTNVFVRDRLLVIYVSHDGTPTAAVDAKVLGVLRKQMGPPVTQGGWPFGMGASGAAAGSQPVGRRLILLGVLGVAAVLLVALAVVLGVLGVRIYRRYGVLQARGLHFRVTRMDPWSPESIEVVLTAYDPARAGSRVHGLRPYQDAAEAIFKALPQYESGDADAFDAACRTAIGSVHSGRPHSPARVARGIRRLWDMHAAAYERWAED